MEELFSLQSLWYKQLQNDKTKLTIHNVHICSDNNDILYTTSVTGSVYGVHTELDDMYGVLSISLELCIFPYDKHIRKQLPLFKHMIPDLNNQKRTIFKDDNGVVYVRIIHEIHSNDYLKEGSLNIPGVFLGVHCRDDCFRKCFKHGVKQPYYYQRV